MSVWCKLEGSREFMYMDLSVRPFAAVLVRAQLLLGAGCAAEPAPPPVAPTVAEPAPPAVTAPLPAAPEVVTPPPIAELSDPVVVKPQVVKPTVIEEIVVPVPVEKVVPVEVLVPDDSWRLLKVAPTCGPCCHGSSNCNRVLAPALDASPDPVPHERER